MNNNVKSSYKYKFEILKNGYEAMGKINLKFSELSIGIDNNELLSYEESLYRESDDFED